MFDDQKEAPKNAPKLPEGYCFVQPNEQPKQGDIYWINDGDFWSEPIKNLNYVQNSWAYDGYPYVARKVANQVTIEEC